ncbi:hypothetical protein BJY52DRAFT_1197466 [Lactarius psammicola]|nr:hypothetical protein BJY52DRAFT_1197466 [Lactarius psammicola]
MPHACALFRVSSFKPNSQSPQVPADLLARMPRLHAYSPRNPPREFYGTVGLAILAVAETAPPRNGRRRRRLVRRTRLAVAECPALLHPPMCEFFADDRAAAVPQLER